MDISILQRYYKNDGATKAEQIVFDLLHDLLGRAGFSWDDVDIDIKTEILNDLTCIVEKKIQEEM